MKVIVEVQRVNKHTGRDYTMVILDSELLKRAAVSRYREMYQTDEADEISAEINGVDTRE